MQGNVLGTALAAALNLRYSYLPELNKKHPQYEKELPDLKNCTSVTVIIDLVYTQHIIKHIIDILKSKYPNLHALNVCSLFYADNCNYTVNGYKNVSIKFLYITQVELNKCPYNKENGLTVNDCVIYVQNLDVIHELFDKDEVKK